MKTLAIFGLLVLFSALNFAQTHNGKYIRQARSTGRGDITVREIRHGKKRAVKFSISASSFNAGSCQGEMKETALWIAKGIAEFRGDFGEFYDCRLTLKFGSNEVVVTEHHCGIFHGMACDFNGTYLRETN